MSKNDSTAAIFSALTELWNLKSPGPNNLILEPAFIRLREACQQKYAIEVRNSLNFGLATALQKLGLPCCSPSYPPAKPLSIEQAVLRLDEGIKAKKAKRLYIAPLDLADNLPEMQFGSVRVLQPHTEKLQQLFAQPLVWSSVTNPNLEVCRFLEFHWLIVEEVVEIHKAPEERAFPFFFPELS